MSFQALARTWRPRRFDELVGQAHVVRALTHALEQDKLHHALLFSGTRGVGKTTLARIIAKCLNCEHGVSAHPCRGDDACGTCREIDEGRFVDLIEVDAASRTGVDDTRDLMDNVQYAPTRGRTKVYLIDEVHMLSKHSFNALLKTLEEPPPRVQFLLATTEPEKIPVTILSRCLQFPLKRLPVAEIAHQLRTIVDAESLSAEEGALTEVARAADGSMRDGLSLLDQAIAFGGGQLETEAVRDMLGTIGQARVAELVDAIVAADATGALDALAALYAQGIDMRYLLEALATAWQHIATIQIVGEPLDDAGEPWRAAAERAEAGAVQVCYDITLAGIRDLAYAPDPLVGVKMTVLRMLAFAPAGNGASEPSPRRQPGPKAANPADTAKAGAAALREQLARARKTKPQSQAPREPAAPQASATPARKPTAQQPVAPEPASSKESETRPAPLEHGPSPQPTPEASVSEQNSSRQWQSQPTAADESQAPAPAPRDTPAASSPASVDKPFPAAAAESEPKSEPAPAEKTTDHPEDWHRLVPRLGLSGLSAQLANNGVCRHLDDDRVVLELARSHELLATPGARDKLQSALAAYWDPKPAPRLAVDFVEETRDTPAMRHEQDAEARQRDAVASIENDPVVRQLRDRLGAQLRADTIKPNRRSAATQQREEQ